ncbi:MAG: hypothetical protein IJK45_10910 [Bacteroidaceae bacterium]|nr:hypothetical protein [Bacteroidaceae bacterium]
MAIFVLYNYQFAKIEEPIEKNLFGESSVEMDAETAFPQKQELLGKLLMDDYSGKRPIRFVGSRGGEYHHQHVIRPTDDITVMHISRRRTQTLTNINFQKRREEDYPYCTVIIDNRPGIQRIAIQNGTKAFPEVKTLQNILETTLNGQTALRRYSLSLSLAHLQNASKFWEYAKDTRNYAAGFHKVTFHLPYINLERLKKAHQSFLQESRASFDSKLDIELTAPEGGAGRVRLDEKDMFQKGLVDYLMEEVGGENIKMYPNSNKTRPIIVGARSYRVIVIPDKTIEDLAKDVKEGNMFGSPALEKVKQETKKFIDPDVA